MALDVGAGGAEPTALRFLGSLRNGAAEHEGLAFLDASLTEGLPDAQAGQQNGTGGQTICIHVVSGSMASFDIVSRVDSMEIENAVNQAKKELANRFDFKGSPAEIVLEKNEIRLTAQDAFKIRALDEIMIGKLAKRNISLKSVEKKDPEISPLGHARQVIKIKQGLESDIAREVSAFVRDLKLKVTVQIQGDELRVAGKNRDDLQSVIAAVRGHDFPVALSFVNFRD